MKAFDQRLNSVQEGIDDGLLTTEYAIELLKYLCLRQTVELLINPKTSTNAIN